MTTKRRNKLIRDINKSVKELVERHVPFYLKPFICQNSDGSFSVSTTESEDPSHNDDLRKMSWREFERAMLDNDDDEIAKNIPRFERLVRKMKRRVNTKP